MFDQLAWREDDWVRSLISLAAHGSSGPREATLDLKFLSGHWGERERGLAPPVSLLSWLIRNLSPPIGETTINEERQRLLARDPATIELALDFLRSRNTDRGWWVFEGPTYPDVVIETPDAIVVVEGKRTEPGPTTCTTWIPDRHQIWRHMDAAWEVRGRRAVFGMFIVAGEGESTAVPAHWRLAVSEALANSAIAGSFPHRGSEERDAIVQGFLGAATWQGVCDQFGIDHAGLPDTTAEIGAQQPLAAVGARSDTVARRG